MKSEVSLKMQRQENPAFDESYRFAACVDLRGSNGRLTIRGLAAPDSFPRNPVLEFRGLTAQIARCGDGATETVRAKNHGSLRLKAKGSRTIHRKSKGAGGVGLFREVASRSTLRRD